ncbi:MAG TPA: ABC transporter ATP-binding protein [Vicinamibacterales bacterium]|nr:ABC transporter ATP-binding protein [Vicinamibacterales bacterium]
MIEDFERLAVTSLSRHYGRRKALSKVTFTCLSGDIVGLLGPNGAGKSTLLAILGTLLGPSEGRVVYGTLTAAQGGASLRARIGMLGHDLFLYPELTAHENLTFFGRMYAVADAPARAMRALERAGLGERAHDAVSGFSRGMRQRVALERALLHAPRLLLLDEPFTGLDQASTAALVGRLREEQARGVLTVLATHDLDVVDGLLTRELFLRGGRMMDVSAGEGSLSERYRAAIASA